MANLKPGVGYVTPNGAKTSLGFTINQSVDIDTLTPRTDIASRMKMRYGKDYTLAKGLPLHSTDAQAALKRLHERGAQGLGTSGLLLNDGKGFDGVPRLSEYMDVYLQPDQRVYDAAHTVYSDEPQFGSSPLNPHEDHKSWTAKQWRAAADMYLKNNRTEILAELEDIEAGLVEGWKKNGYGVWIPIKGYVPPARIVPVSPAVTSFISNEASVQVLSKLEEVLSAVDMALTEIREARIEFSNLKVQVQSLSRGR